MMLIQKSDLHVFLAQNRDKREYFSFILLALVIVTLPFFIQLNSLCVIALSGLWLISGNWKQKAKYFLSQPLLYLPVLMFLLLIISYALSHDKKTGGFELEKKLSLLAFPLIFSGIIFNDWRKRKVLMALFVFACLAAALICLGFAFTEYSKLGSNAFFYHQLSSPLGFHAVYFSCYISFCIILLFVPLTEKLGTMTSTERNMQLFTLIFLLFFLVLLSSKTILAATLLMMLFIPVTRVVKRRQNLKLLLGSAALLILLVVMISRTDYIKGRFSEIARENYTEVLASEDYRHIAFTGGTIRLAIWKSVIEILNSENAWLFGTGIGDAQNKLTQHYKEKNIYPGDEVLGFKGFLHYNAHNQYFEFLISTGLCGTLLFLTWLILLFYKAIRTQKTEWICFMILMCFFFFTESVLSAHKGVVLFMLVPLLYNAGPEEKESD